MQTSHLLAHSRTLASLSCWEEALESLDQALAIEPDWEELWKYRSELLVELNRPEEAIEALGKWLDIAPEAADGYYLRGLLLAQSGQFTDALIDLRLYTELEPEDVLGHLQLGCVLDDLSRFSQALEALEKALDVDPAHAESYYYQASVLLKSRKYNEAWASIELGIGLDPEDLIEYHLLASRIQIARNKYRKALQQLDEVETIQADHPLIAYQRAVIFDQMGMPQRAVEQIDIHLGNMPDDAVAWHFKSHLHLALEDPKEALTAIEEAIKLNPESIRYKKFRKYLNYLISKEAWRKSGALKVSKQFDKTPDPSNDPDL
ncbi:tetratricopeptide repeat protein [Pontibacter sp. G13]|uniref:tetratricopeptide repeat protein n=1 Tax=Pontibacter sp. G13 TaxID=3074898 RepID=UPI00288B429C|nr:tetratricopeptide repeat protein [Pontibacter sp. G13]WNJ17758.1 tetratricopeptide repeat protein [Pontibacter sp. G13]